MKLVGYCAELLYGDLNMVGLQVSFTGVYLADAGPSLPGSHTYIGEFQR